MIGLPLTCGKEYPDTVGMAKENPRKPSDEGRIAAARTAMQRFVVEGLKNCLKIHSPPMFTDSGPDILMLEIIDVLGRKQMNVLFASRNY